jgi:hypothetical protein
VTVVPSTEGRRKPRTEEDTRRLDVHPRVIMRILRHADQAVTVEIYAKASSKATQEALRRLGESLR